MPRFVYHLPGLRFERPWRLGPARFVQRDVVAEELLPAFDAPARSRSHEAARDLAAERFAEWGDDACLEVVAEDFDQATELAAEAMSVLRLVMRKHVSVNVEIHRVGLVGEIPYGIRHVLVISDDSPPVIAPGWQRIGGTVEFGFAETTLDEWDNDPIVAFLAEQLATPRETRSPAGSRAYSALAMYDAGLRAITPTLRILTSVIAIEVLFSRDDMGKAPQTTAIARRIAYLTCTAGCGRVSPHCPYTESQKGHKQLVEDLRHLARAGQAWMCSAFLDIVAPDDIQGLPFTPIFDCRHEIAHRGRLSVDERDRSHLLWVADEALQAGLRWYAAHPTGDMAALDAEIGGPVPTQERPENTDPNWRPG